MMGNPDYSARNTEGDGGDGEQVQTLVSVPASGAVEFQSLLVGSIRPSGDNVRIYFDDDTLAELAESIRNHGVLQPITVITPDDPFAQPYTILTGERRWRAAKMAGLTEIPAIIRESCGAAEAVEIRLAENEDRETINPIERARAYAKLIELGYSEDKVSARTGKRQPEVAKDLMLLRLPESAQVAVAGGKLSRTHGVVLSGLVDWPQDAESVCRKAVEHGWSVALLTQEVRAVQSDRRANAEAEAKRLQPGLGLDVPPPPANRPASPAPASSPSAAPAAAPAPAPASSPDADVQEENPNWSGREDDPEDIGYPDDHASIAAELAGADDVADTMADLGTAAADAASDPPAQPAPAAPPTVKPADVAAPPVVVSSGARIGSAILQTDDDWLFEVNMTIDQALAELRANYAYRLTPLGRKILKTLTGTYNDNNPDEPVTLAARLDALLVGKAVEAGYDIETLKEIPE